MTPPKSQLAFQLKTLFMGSDGTIPESYARTAEKKQLAAWIKEEPSQIRQVLTVDSAGRRFRPVKGQDLTCSAVRFQDMGDSAYSRHG